MAVAYTFMGYMGNASKVWVENPQERRTRYRVKVHGTIKLNRILEESVVRTWAVFKWFTEGSNGQLL
jgi:hypothetical protein